MGGSVKSVYVAKPPVISAVPGVGVDFVTSSTVGLHVLKVVRDETARLRQEQKGTVAGSRPRLAKEEPLECELQNRGRKSLVFNLLLVALRRFTGCVSTPSLPQFRREAVTNVKH